MPEKTTVPAAPLTTPLPHWRRVLVVVAHPDDESFGLGAVLDYLVAQGTAVDVLCLTRGEASTLHGVAGDLAVIREAELAQAAAALGVGGTVLRDHPDGGLAAVPEDVLADEVARVAPGAEALVVFDPSGVTGHPDHAAATRAAVAFADREDLPVLAWTLPATVAEQLSTEYGAGFTGHRPEEIDVVLPVDRERQLRAAQAHASQALPTSVLWRRLELLGAVEHLRWIRPPV